MDFLRGWSCLANQLRFVRKAISKIGDNWFHPALSDFVRYKLYHQLSVSAIVEVVQLTNCHILADDVQFLAKTAVFFIIIIILSKRVSL